MKKQNLYYFELDCGCGIHASTTLKKAEKELLAEYGWGRFKSVKKATKENISWVQAMGGYIPEV